MAELERTKNGVYKLQLSKEELGVLLSRLNEEPEESGRVEESDRGRKVAELNDSLREQLGQIAADAMGSADKSRRRRVR